MTTFFRKFRGKKLSRMASYEKFRGNKLSRIWLKTAKPRKFLPAKVSSFKVGGLETGDIIKTMFG